MPTRAAYPSQHTQYEYERARSIRFRLLRERRMERVWWRFCEAAVLGGESAQELLKVLHPSERCCLIMRRMRRGGLAGFRFANGLEAADHACDAFSPAAAPQPHCAPAGPQRLAALAARLERGEDLFDGEGYWEEANENCD